MWPKFCEIAFGFLISKGFQKLTVLNRLKLVKITVYLTKAKLLLEATFFHHHFYLLEIIYQSKMAMEY